jgi:hypothetical protein
MPERFDSSGTAPGLATPNAVKKDKVIAMKCRNPKCDSTQVTEVVQASNPVAGVPHVRIYQCVKCLHTLHVNTGGYAGF